jgi:ATP-binding cassette subfamily C protein CydC
MCLLPLSAFEAVAAMPAAAQAWNRARACRTSGLVPGDAENHRLAPPALPARDERLRRVAIIGPSGAGKTTLLQSWAGGGAVFFAEDAHIFDTSVVENLRVARGDLTDAAAADALRQVGLADWLAGLPDGMHTHLVGGAAAVSGGQRRRILLARALISRATVLLLDEPTEHLDAGDGAALLRALLDVGSGLVAPDRAVVVVTHQLPADHAADLVLTLPLAADFSFDGKSVASTCARDVGSRYTRKEVVEVD